MLSSLETGAARRRRRRRRRMFPQSQEFTRESMQVEKLNLSVSRMVRGWQSMTAIFRSIFNHRLTISPRLLSITKMKLAWEFRRKKRSAWRDCMSYRQCNKSYFLGIIVFIISASRRYFGLLSWESSLNVSWNANQQHLSVWNVNLEERIVGLGARKGCNQVQSRRNQRLNQELARACESNCHCSAGAYSSNERIFLRTRGSGGHYFVDHVNDGTR